MTIAFRRIILPRHHDKLCTGASATILAEVINTEVIDTLLDPTTPPVVSFFDPLGVQKTVDSVMIRVSLGLFKATYRTPFSSPLGVYTGNISAEYNEDVAHLERISLFKTIRLSGGDDGVVIPPPIDLNDVSYLIMRDQTGFAWYYWITVVPEIMHGPAIPVFSLKNSVALNVIPAYWIVMTNSAALTRYVYPDVTGSLLASATQPPIGTGIANPPLWIGEAGLNYVLSLNIMDDILILGA